MPDLFTKTLQFWVGYQAAYPDRAGERNHTMDTPSPLYTVGLFDDRYRAFLETLVEVRPKLHRYCARMAGSVMDGEDVVQESLFEAYRKLDQYDESRPLTPWLFGIAHHRCLDFLRRRETRKDYESAVAQPDTYSPAPPPVLGIGQALGNFLPPPFKHRQNGPISIALQQDANDAKADDLGDEVRPVDAESAGDLLHRSDPARLRQDNKTVHNDRFLML